MEKAQKAIARLKEYFTERIQMFDHRGWTPDYKVSIYNDDTIEILYAPDWGYVEVLGATAEEYNAIFKECGC